MFRNRVECGVKLYTHSLTHSDVVEIIYSLASTCIMRLQLAPYLAHPQNSEVGLSFHPPVSCDNYAAIVSSLRCSESIIRSQVRIMRAGSRHAEL